MVRASTPGFLLLAITLGQLLGLGAFAGRGRDSIGFGDGY